MQVVNTQKLNPRSHSRLISIAKQRFAVLLIAMIVFIACLSTSTKTSIAQESSGLRLTTSPLPINLTTTPGQPISTELRVRNSGSQEEVLQVGLLKFTADSSTGQASLLPREDGDDYFDWVTFSPSQFTLAPNQWQTVQMTIDVPDSAAFAYYYAVTFSRADEITGDIGQSTLQGAAATLVLLEVNVPGAVRELKLESFTASGQWYEFLPVRLEARIRNSGNVHAIPFGSVFIKQGDQTIDELVFNPARGNILPDSPREYSVDWERGFPVYSSVAGDQGQETSKLEWDFTKADNLRFGKYSAELVAAYDSGDRDVPIEGYVEFWVIPWRFLLGGLLLALFSIFGIYMFGRSIWQKFNRHDEDYY